MNDQQTSKPRSAMTRKVSVLVAALAIVGMGATTVGCASHTEKPATPGSSAVSVVPTEKGCFGGPGSVHDSAGCAGKHHNANGPHRGNKANKAGGVTHNSHAGRNASHGGGHAGGGHQGGGGGRGHK